MKAVNLLPSDQRGSGKSAVVAPVRAEKEGTPFGAYVVLGVLALAVAASALLVLAGNQVKQRRAELATVTAKATATQAKAAALQSFADFDSLASQRVETVRSLAASRFDWDRTLADLARALPANVHLRTVDGITAQTAGGDALRGSIQAPSMELVGCTTSQMAVANLMSRLRNVRGVTRVALNNSVKAEPMAATAPTASAAGEGEPAQLCPKGSPPDFDVTMFFERAALPAGATVNPGAATAAPAATTSTTTTTTTSSTPAAGATPAPTGTATTTTTSTQGGTP